MRRPFSLLVALVLLGSCTEEDQGGFGEPPPVIAAPSSDPDIDLRFPRATVRITAPGGLRFEPTSLKIPSGLHTQFKLVNDDAQEHTLVISELAVVMLAAPGQTVSTSMPIDPRNKGKFTFFCSISGHREAGMEGTITVS